MDDSIRSGPQRDFSHSATLFRSLSLIALAGHSIILVAMVVVQIWPLVIINVISVALYGGAILLNRRRLYFAVLTVGLVEVTVHAVVATFILGWDSGFHVYLLTLLPLVFFFDPWPVRVRVAVSLVIVVFYVAFAWYSTYYIAADLRPFVEWFRYGNLFIGAIVLAALSYYYGAAVGRARSDLEAKNVQLDTLARTDALTGLANRREALGIIERESVRAFRASESFSIGLVDIDHFKQVNDEHGHSCGDVALRAVSDALRATLRAQDTVARWGGEEFLLVLPATDLAGARVAAEKVRAAVADTRVDLAEASIRLTVTIGLAVVDHTVPVVDVLKRADEALYAGKATGRDRVELSE